MCHVAESIHKYYRVPGLSDTQGGAKCSTKMLKLCLGSLLPTWKPRMQAPRGPVVHSEWPVYMNCPQCAVGLGSAGQLFTGAEERTEGWEKC